MADCMNKEYKKKKEKIRSVLPGHDFSATLTNLKNCSFYKITQPCNP